MNNGKLIILMIEWKLIPQQLVLVSSACVCVCVVVLPCVLHVDDICIF